MIAGLNHLFDRIAGRQLTGSSTFPAINAPFFDRHPIVFRGSAPGGLAFDWPRFFKLLARTEELEMRLGGRNPPSEQLVVNTDHERLRATEVVVTVPVWHERFDQVGIDGPTADPFVFQIRRSGLGVPVANDKIRMLPGEGVNRAFESVRASVQGAMNEYDCSMWGVLESA